MGHSENFCGFIRLGATLVSGSIYLSPYDIISEFTWSIVQNMFGRIQAIVTNSIN